MKFLTQNDINLLISCENLEEITNCNSALYEVAEQRALAIVKASLRSTVDVDYELRPWVDYQYGVEYTDLQRVRVSNNEANDEFGTQWNLQLLDYLNITETIFVKIPNTCPPSTFTEPVIANWIPDIHYYYTINNQLGPTNGPAGSNFDPSCGVIITNNGSIATNKILNYYNSIYSTAGHTITEIDYTSITTQVANTYFNNPNNFDQYLLSNVSRDFYSDDRNTNLVIIVGDIWKYELFSRIAPRQISQIVVDRYNDAKAWLKGQANGNTDMNLKPYKNSIAFQQNMGILFGDSINNFRWRY